MFANTEIELIGCLLQGKAQWVKFAVMDHFVSLVLTVVAVIALSIYYGLAALFFVGLIIVGAKFVFFFPIRVGLSEESQRALRSRKGVPRITTKDVLLLSSPQYLPVSLTEFITRML